jgi:hypothetical protein
MKGHRLREPLPPDCASLAFSSGCSGVNVTDRWGAGEELAVSRSSISLILSRARLSTSRALHSPSRHWCRLV